MARPKEFDPIEAVDRAVDVFWGQGYGATPHGVALTDEFRRTRDVRS
ncbi:hypothetical protein [Arthrobacter sp. SLBN-53]|nr:hypothetical protein [Arthrobacter sp. SLBN-53]